MESKHLTLTHVWVKDEDHMGEGGGRMSGECEDEVVLGKKMYRENR